MKKTTGKATPEAQIRGVVENTTARRITKEDLARRFACKASEVEIVLAKLNREGKICQARRCTCHDQGGTRNGKLKKRCWHPDTYAVIREEDRR
jgi:hypothetical protein